MEKDIKDYREKELRNYVIGNVLLILIATGLLDQVFNPVADATMWSSFSALFSSALFSAIAYIYVYIFDSLIPPNIKDNLLWIIKGRPGESVFTEIRDTDGDVRFRKEDVLEKYADVYEKIDAERDEQMRRKIQNSSWYKIYKAHEKEASVFVSQRDSLLSRDMSIITFWIIIGYIIIKLLVGIKLHWGLMTFLLAEMIITWLSARSKVKRFVYNVIAADVDKRRQ